MAWNPLQGTPGGWNEADVADLATQDYHAVTGVDLSQGQPYPDDIQAVLQQPQALGVNQKGYINPYSLTLYSYQVSATQATRVVPPNLKRAYLLLQNQGPGNVWINFGQDVTIATTETNSNGLQLIQTQILEQIGGGDVDAAGRTRMQAFVSPDYISIITDTAGTTVLVGEGIWRAVSSTGNVMY